MVLIAAKRVPLPGETFPGRDEAAEYDQHAKKHMLPVYRHFARQIAGMKRFEGRVLEIGTGSALLAIQLARSANWLRPITAMDVSPEMLQLARMNVRQAGLIGQIDLVLASAASLPFVRGSFDLVVSNASLHCWKDPLAVFNQIRQVVKEDGLCLIRDNLRLPPILSPLIDLIAGWSRMNPAQKELWWKALNASYTRGEVRTLLDLSELKGARVGLNPTFLDLNIRWSSPANRKTALKRR